MLEPQDLRVTAIALCSIAIQWQHTPNGEFPYQAAIGAKHLAIRVNDFPAEPLYTLMIDGKEALDLEDWCPAWTKPAALEG